MTMKQNEVLAIFEMMNSIQQENERILVVNDYGNSSKYDFDTKTVEDSGDFILTHQTKSYAYL